MNIDIHSELDSDEDLLWDGIPQQGWRLVPSDIVMIPFSVFGFGFAVFWTYVAYTAVSNAAPEEGLLVWLFPVFGVLFVVVSFFGLIGRFPMDAARRRKTQYAITNRRAIILKRGFPRSLRSFSLNRMSEIEVSETKNGRGTIRFGREVRQRSSLDEWISRGRFEKSFEFEGIADVKHVAKLIRTALAESD